MRDSINETYEEMIKEAEDADKIAADLLKEFNKRIKEEVKKSKAKGIEANRAVQWIQWKISRAWGR